MALAAAQDRAGVKMQLLIASDKRIVSGSRVCLRVADFEVIVLQDGMGTDGLFHRRRVGPEADVRLEPLPVLVHERDQGDRHLANPGGQTHDIVEPLFRRRIQYLQLDQLPQAIILIRRHPGLHIRFSRRVW